MLRVSTRLHFPGLYAFCSPTMGSGWNYLWVEIQP
jgi:hypothetical protein